MLTRVSSLDAPPCSSKHTTAYAQPFQPFGHLLRRVASQLLLTGSSIITFIWTGINAKIENVYAPIAWFLVHKVSPLWPRLTGTRVAGGGCLEHPSRLGLYLLARLSVQKPADHECLEDELP